MRWVEWTIRLLNEGETIKRNWIFANWWHIGIGLVLLLYSYMYCYGKKIYEISQTIMHGHQTCMHGWITWRAYQKISARLEFSFIKEQDDQDQHQDQDRFKIRGSFHNWESRTKRYICFHLQQKPKSTPEKGETRVFHGIFPAVQAQHANMPMAASIALPYFFLSSTRLAAVFCCSLSTLLITIGLLESQRFVYLPNICWL